ncbi:MAG: LEA type 2 family protein [Deltaproteobacteria bacterium]|nr:LEA type 2 family protein [Deltaproteobacteria bacterium]
MNRAQRIGVLALVGALLATGTSCALLRQIFSNVKLPQVKVTRVDPELKSLTNAVLHFKLSIKNPNPIGLQLEGVRYTLDVEGREVGRGSTRKGLKLKASGSSQTAIDLDVPLLKVAASLIDLLNKGAANYKGELALAFETPVGPIEVPITHKGNMPLPKKPPIAISKVRVGRIDLNGAQLIFDTKVDNPNPFQMPIDKLQMAVKINNRSLAGVSAPSGLMMQPGQPVTVPLTLNVSPSSIGLSAAEFLRRPSLNYAADLVFASGPLSLPVKQSGKFSL